MGATQQTRKKQKKKQKNKRKRKKNFFFVLGNLKEEVPKGPGTSLSLSQMNTFYQEPVDWIDCPWGGPYDEEEEEDYIVLPVQGPVNKDGASLGFLVITL